MKIHNPGNIDLEPHTLRQMVEKAALNLDPREVLAQESVRRDQKLADTRRIEQLLDSGAGRNAPAVIRPAGHSGQNVDSPEAWAERRSRERVAEAGGRRAYERGSEPEEEEAAAFDVNPAREQRPSLEERAAEATKLRRRTRLIQQVIAACQALELLDVDTLKMEGYPTAAAMLLAKRRSDLLWLGVLLCAGVFLVALLGQFNPWLTGTMLGAAVLLTALQIGAVRAIVFSDPGYSALQARRKSLESAALNHIRVLEGRSGLVYQCQMMSAEYEALHHRQFQRLILLSRKGLLLKAMRHAGAIRLYLRYAMIARAGYLALKRDYVTINHRLRTEFSDLEE